MNGAATHRIEVFFKREFNDTEALSSLALLRSAGASSVKNVRVSRVYEIRGTFTISQINRLSRDLLADPVTQEFKILPPTLPLSNGGPLWRADIRLKSAVSDPAADTIREAIVDMGFPTPDFVRVSSIFKIESKCGKPQIEAVLARSLANPVIHSFSVAASS